MNYLKHYITLVRRNNISNDKTEKHHIFPTSIFGENNKIAILSTREHFVAHKLLYMIYKKRYGENHEYTKKMLHAARMMLYGFNRFQRITVSSYWYAKFRDHNRERCIGENNPSKKFETRKKISESKKGVARPDIKGKRYFGASEESIANGIKQMVLSKRKTMDKNLLEYGRKINYPKNRNSSPCSPEKAQKIRESKQIVDQKFKEMSENEFETWISSKNLFRKDGRPNPNITRILKIRNIPKERYYN